MLLRSTVLKKHLMLLSASAAQPLSRILQDAGLRPTRQRIALAGLLRTMGPAHYSAESLHKLATDSHIPVSLATVYNTLHQFSGAGLMRQIAVSGHTVYFDTDVAEHPHFLVEREGRIIDISAGEMRVCPLPDPPHGHVVTQVDVVVHLRRVEHSHLAQKCSGKKSPQRFI